jgi:hypothetical protein
MFIGWCTKFTCARLASGPACVRAAESSVLSLHLRLALVAYWRLLQVRRQHDNGKLNVIFFLKKWKAELCGYSNS